MSKSPQKLRQVPEAEQGAHQLSQAVAENLRRLRSDKDLSLERLAARSGVSRAMLNQIELGRSTPTIALLWKIAAGLGVPFSELLSQREQAEIVLLTHEHSKILFNAEQTFSSRALFPFDVGYRTTEFYELSIKPGGVERANAHTRGTREYLTLVQGVVEVVVGDETFTLHPRDTLVFRADVAHAYRNPSVSDEARLYLVMTYDLPG
jgi:transcriptional regulator with XRE-family HTH domain